jgi:glycosyltransferase involved in cell wall biosynthesis
LSEKKREGGLRLRSETPGSFDLSVITVCYNDAEGLELTANSVQRSLDENVEYIVVDGGSSDGTVDLLGKLSFINYWVSEPDSGIYDAMNKGIALAQGRALLFMNAGDFIDGDIPLGKLPAPSFLPVWYKNPFGNFRKIAIKSEKKGMPNCHQGVVFEHKGLTYDTNYRISGDYEFFLRHGYDCHLPVADVEGRIVFDSSGISSTLLADRDAEIAEIIHAYFGPYRAFAFRCIASAKRGIKAVLRSKNP